MERVALGHGGWLASLALGAGAGTPVVMVHGLVHGHMAGWYFGAAPALAQRRRVVLYDQRGHGSSPLAAAGETAHFDLDSQGADLRAVLAHHGLEGRPVDLVGHSMGALVVLRHALRHPQRVRRLVLVDAPMPAREHAGPSLLEAPPDAVPAGRRETRRRRRLAALLAGSTLVQDVLAMGPEPDAELAALRCPVLLVYGRQSPCLNAASLLQARLPDARRVLLEGGHELLEDAPAALRATLEAFLGDA